MGRSKKARRQRRVNHVKFRDTLPWAPKSLPELLERAVPPMTSAAPAENRLGARLIGQTLSAAELYWLGSEVMPVVASFADDLSREDVLGTIARGTTAIVVEDPLPPLPALPDDTPAQELFEGLSLSGMVWATNAAGLAFIIPLVGALELLKLDPAVFAATEDELAMVFGSNPELPGETDLVAAGALLVGALADTNPLFEAAKWFTAARLLCDIPGAVTHRDMRVLRRGAQITRGRAAVTPKDVRGVRVVNLSASTAKPSHAGAGDGSRTYEYRWPVKGHNRLQACGPGLTERRLTWIPPHMKGPEGAPLLRKVTAWTDPKAVTPPAGDRALVGSRP